MAKPGIPRWWGKRAREAAIRRELEKSSRASSYQGMTVPENFEEIESHPSTRTPRSGLVGNSAYERGQGNTRRRGGYRAPPGEGETREDRINTKNLPVWAVGRGIVKIRARRLSDQERRSVVDYWLNVWKLTEGDQRDLGQWSDGGPYFIGGYEIETDIDFILEQADHYNIPLPDEDIYTL